MEVTYANVLMTIGVSMLAWVLKEQRRQCNLLLKIKTAIVQKFPELEPVLR